MKNNGIITLNQPSDLGSFSGADGVEKLSLDSLNKELNDNIILATEYQRQIDYHKSNLDQANANNVALLLAPVNSKIENLRANLSMIDRGLFNLNNALVRISISPITESSMSVAPTSRFNRMFSVQQADSVQLSPSSLAQQVQSEPKTVIPPPTKKAPLEKTNESEDSGDDEAFRAGDSDEEESDDDGKILGMPKAIAIGVGVAVVAIGGFLIYRKVKGK